MLRPLTAQQGRNQPFRRGHYPPIDVLQSLSRTMPMVVDDSHVQASREARELIAAYDDIEDLVSIGAYRAGSKPIADRAIARIERINGFLKQDKKDGTPFSDAVRMLHEVVTGG